MVFFGFEMEVPRLLLDYFQAALAAGRGNGRGMVGAPQAVRSTERSEPPNQPDPEGGAHILSE